MLACRREEHKRAVVVLMEERRENRRREEGVHRMEVRTIAKHPVSCYWLLDPPGWQM